MNTIFPAATACFVVAFVATVGYAESKSELESNSSKQVVIDEGMASEAGISESEMPLSVAPLAHRSYPDDRPAWIAAAPDLDSSDHTWVVTTNGYDTMEQCEAELQALLPAAVALYIKETTGWICDDDLLDDHWIENDLVSARYVGQFTQGDLELNEIAMQLQFDAEDRAKIRSAMKRSVVSERLKAAGGLFTLGLIGLCCTGGLLGFVSRRFAGPLR